MKFLALSLLVYGGLTAWVASRVDATTEEWTYTFSHLALAAALNAHLLHAARARSLALLSPPVVFLLVSQLYFTINGLKYFSPILLYPQFELSLTAQFVGSVAGAVVLFACALLLRTQRGPTSARVLGWICGYWPDLRRLLLVSVAGSLACKAALFMLGYGSPYADTEFTEHVVRSYADFFLILGNETFGLSSLLLGSLYLMRPRVGDRRRPLTAAAAFVGVLTQVAHMLLFIKARMILLVTAVIVALTAEIRSRRTAERLLALLFLALPPVSLLGMQLTLLLGRINVPEETGLRLAIGAINRRADLTDFATAIVVNSAGEAHDAGIVTSAALNAVPLVVFPGKREIVKDVYSKILNEHLGWPAYEGGIMLADYQDSAFSAGVMSFGVVGFALVPLALIWLLYQAARGLERIFKRSGYGLALLALSLAAMRVEVEWATIPLSLRQAVLVGVIFWTVVWAAREGHRILMVASRPAAGITPRGGPA
ncbi:MAG: hypothetical protein H0V43_03375 [Gemmatimonadales bacterium]|nr:hypothetical protein [Gemmatimonadales bacterium]MBA3553556.1 hypothetical protein [Gemmatimonadales bacterium]